MFIICRMQLKESDKRIMSNHYCNCSISCQFLHHRATVHLESEIGFKLELLVQASGGPLDKSKPDGDFLKAPKNLICIYLMLSGMERRVGGKVNRVSE